LSGGDLVDRLLAVAAVNWVGGKIAGAPFWGLPNVIIVCPASEIPGNVSLATLATMSPRNIEAGCEVFSARAAMIAIVVHGLVPWLREHVRSI